MTYDRVLARLAEAQHGVFSRPQYLAQHVSDDAVEHRVRQGRIIVVHHGVYRVAGQPATPHQRILAACLAAGEGSVASHRAAAFLLGLGVEPRPEVSVAGSRYPRVRGVAVHRVRRLERVDTEVHDAIPRTRPARTLIDLAGAMTPAELAQAFDEALVRRLVTCGYVERRLEAVGSQGRSGANELRKLLAERSDNRPRAQSRFERRVLAVFAEAGLPRPVTQYRVALPGGSFAILDVAYPDLRIDIEADSYRYHASRSAWSHDHIRNRLLTAMGWLVLPVTWDDLVERPNHVVELVALARTTQLIAKLPA